MSYRRNARISGELANFLEARFPKLADNPLVIFLLLSVAIGALWAAPWVIDGHYQDEDIFTSSALTVIFYSMFFVGLFRRKDRKRREKSAAEYAASVARVNVNRAVESGR